MKGPGYPSSDREKLDLFARQSLARLADFYSAPTYRACGKRNAPLKTDTDRFKELQQRFERADKWPST